jgi:hypothetical protein
VSKLRPKNTVGVTTYFHEHGKKNMELEISGGVLIIQRLFL